MSYVPRVLWRDVERPFEVAAGSCCCLLFTHTHTHTHGPLGNKIRDGIHRHCHCSKRLIGKTMIERRVSPNPVVLSSFFFFFFYHFYTFYYCHVSTNEFLFLAYWTNWIYLESLCKFSSIFKGFRLKYVIICFFLEEVVEEYFNINHCFNTEINDTKIYSRHYFTRK